MANNQYVNKVVYDGRTLIDITDTIFDPLKLPIGSVVYAANGERVVGNAIVCDVYRGTTEYWNSRLGYIPNEGDIIVYTDKGSIVNSNNETIDVPGIKIGDGLAYCVDLPFVGDDISQKLVEHINDTERHITEEERLFWNNKVNCQDSVVNETLILNRN